MKTNFRGYLLLLALAVSAAIAWGSVRNREYQKTNPQWFPQKDGPLKLSYEGPAKGLLLSPSQKLDRDRFLNHNSGMVVEDPEHDHIFRLRNTGLRPTVMRGWGASTPQWLMRQKKEGAFELARYIVTSQADIVMKPGES